MNPSEKVYKVKINVTSEDVSFTALAYVWDEETPDAAGKRFVFKMKQNFQNAEIDVVEVTEATGRTPSMAGMVYPQL